MNKFLRDLAGSFLLAVVIVAASDASKLIEAGSREQLVIAAVAVGRAALAAGFAAVLPKLLALRNAQK